MIVVVGAGAVGLAVACELAGLDEVLVLERNRAPGLETSAHNSGVVHAGIYYPTGSLKHRLCIEGNRLLYQWAADHSVRVARSGKLIIAVEEGDLGALEEVERQARANDVPGIRRLTAVEANALEPSVRSVAALLSETSGVIDQAAFVRSLASEAKERGVMIALEHEVLDSERCRPAFRLQVRDPEGVVQALDCDVLVNSAGLWADRVAEMLGYDVDESGGCPRLRQTVNRGRYYDIVNPEKARRHKHLVYPVPEHRAGGLGVHVTVDIDGQAHLGPDTEWLEPGAAFDYRSDDTRREAFWLAAHRYLPDLALEDIAPGQVGYRPKIQRPGEDQQDFLVWRDGGYVHLGGIESPGLTASLALARHVRDLLA